MQWKRLYYFDPFEAICDSLINQLGGNRMSKEKSRKETKKLDPVKKNKLPNKKITDKELSVKELDGVAGGAKISKQDLIKL
jgi:hypothetical protein